MTAREPSDWRARRRSLSRDLSRTVARHRRLLAAIAAGLTAVSVLAVLRPDPPSTEPILIASRDLASGTRLQHDDLATVEMPPGLVPDGAYPPGEAPTGRVLAGPVRRGEPLTDAGLVGPGLASMLPAGQVLSSVEVPATTAWLVRAGDEVDVLAGDARGTTSVVAAAATVVAVRRSGSDGATGGVAVVLALDDSAALTVSQAALVSPLGLLVRPG